MDETLVYGIHAVSALLANPYRSGKILYVSERQDQKITTLIEKAKEKGFTIEHLNKHDMQSRFPHLVHQGIVAITSTLPDYSEKDIPFLLEKGQKPYLILILDSITDPHNLGACLRTADATKVDFVVIPKDKSAPMTPVVAKVACGAMESVPVVRVTNLARAMETLKAAGVWIYGATEQAEKSLYQLQGQGDIALVFGAEGQGMRRLTKEKCDGLFSIPMQGQVESLNVSVATAVALYEIIRQRLG